MSGQKSSPVPGRRGRPPCCPRELAVRIVEMRRRDMTYEQISDVLNAEGIPTPLGRPVWFKSSVDRLLHTRYVEELMEEIGAR